jgi:hypothetical protein
MKTIYLAAAMLLASTAAHAGGSNAYNFEIQGQKIHVEAPKNCNSLSCIHISGVNFKGLNTKNDDDDKTPAATPAPAPAPAAQAPVAAPAPVAAAPQPPAVNYPPPPAAVATTDQPTLHDVVPGAPLPPAATPPAPPAPPPVAAAAPQPVAAAVAPTTPIGVWATEENKGNVKIEQCGANLCGYTLDTREKILINMKPENAKWTGQIHDPDSGRDYDSTIAMKGANILKVQGCAFGGMFCGGQTWKRIS